MFTLGDGRTVWGVPSCGLLAVAARHSKNSSERSSSSRCNEVKDSPDSRGFVLCGRLYSNRAHCLQFVNKAFYHGAAVPQTSLEFVVISPVDLVQQMFVMILQDLPQ